MDQFNHCQKIKIQLKFLSKILFFGRKELTGVKGAELNCWIGAHMPLWMCLKPGASQRSACTETPDGVLLSTTLLHSLEGPPWGTRGHFPGVVKIIPTIPRTVIPKRKTK